MTFLVMIELQNLAQLGNDTIQIHTPRKASYLPSNHGATMGHGWVVLAPRLVAATTAVSSAPFCTSGLEPEPLNAHINGVTTRNDTPGKINDIEDENDGLVWFR